MPPVSLLIPCFQAGRLLPRLIRSARSQRIPFSEIIAYDDGSTDETLAVARSLGIAIHAGGVSRGLSHARNQLAEAARGEWIHFHTPNDELAPDFLERLGRECNARNDLVTCDADWIDDSTGARHRACRYEPDRLHHDPTRCLLGQPMSLSQTLINRDRWLVLSGCDETMRSWDEAEVIFRFALEGAVFHHVPEVLTWLHPQGDGPGTHARESARDQLAFLRKHALDPRVAHLRERLAAQAEETAVNLIELGDRPSAAEAARLAQRLGRRLPTSQHAAWSILRPCFPGFALLRLQTRLRRRGKSPKTVLSPESDSSPHTP